MAMLAFAIGSTIWFASGGDSQNSVVSEGTTIRSDTLGIAVTVPSGWRQLPLPRGTVTHKLAVFTDKRYISDSCDSPADRTTIALELTEIGEGRDTEYRYPALGSMSLDADSGTGLFKGDQHDCDQREQLIRFSDGGRRFNAVLTVAKNAPDQRRAEAYGIVASLRQQ